MSIYEERLAWLFSLTWVLPVLCVVGVVLFAYAVKVEAGGYLSLYDVYMVGKRVVLGVLLAPFVYTALWFLWHLAFETGSTIEGVKASFESFSQGVVTLFKIALGILGFSLMGGAITDSELERQRRRRRGY